MGGRTRSTHKDGRRSVSENPHSFPVPSTGVRPAYAVRTTGTPPARRRVPSSVSSWVGSSKWSFTLRPLLQVPGLAGKFQVSQVKVFSFLDSDELADSQKACRFLSDLLTQSTQRGLQPEDWKGQRPHQPKRPLRSGKFLSQIGNEEKVLVRK